MSDSRTIGELQITNDLMAKQSALNAAAASGMSHNASGVGHAVSLTGSSVGVTSGGAQAQHDRDIAWARSQLFTSAPSIPLDDPRKSSWVGPSVQNARYTPLGDIRAFQQFSAGFTPWSVPVGSFNPANYAPQPWNPYSNMSAQANAAWTASNNMGGGMFGPPPPPGFVPQPGGNGGGGWWNNYVRNNNGSIPWLGRDMGSMSNFARGAGMAIGIGGTQLIQGYTEQERTGRFGGSSAAAGGGAIAGGLIGAAIGSFFPGGAYIGGMAGAHIGGMAGQAIYAPIERKSELMINSAELSTILALSRDTHLHTGLEGGRRYLSIYNQINSDPGSMAGSPQHFASGVSRQSKGALLDWLLPKGLKSSLKEMAMADGQSEKMKATEEDVLGYLQTITAGSLAGGIDLSSETMTGMEGGWSRLGSPSGKFGLDGTNGAIRGAAGVAGMAAEMYIGRSGGRFPKNENYQRFLARSVSIRYGTAGKQAARDIGSILEDAPDLDVNYGIGQARGSLTDTLMKHGALAVKTLMEMETNPWTGVQSSYRFFGDNEPTLSEMSTVSSAFRSSTRSARVNTKRIRGGARRAASAMDASAGLIESFDPDYEESETYQDVQQGRRSAHLSAFGAEDALGFGMQSMRHDNAMKRAMILPFGPGRVFDLSLQGIGMRQGRIGQLRKRMSSMKQNGILSEQDELAFNTDIEEMVTQNAQDVAMLSEGAENRMPAMSAGMSSGLRRFDSSALAAFNLALIGHPSRRFGSVSGGQSKFQNAFLRSAVPNLPTGVGSQTGGVNAGDALPLLGQIRDLLSSMNSKLGTAPRGMSRTGGVDSLQATATGR